MKLKKKQVEKTKIVESSDAPALDQNENFSKLTRKEALAESKRIIARLSIIGYEYV